MDCVLLDHVACRVSLDHLRWLSRDLTLVTFSHPWDIEMMVDESLSDDEDGDPHSVSDSESESASEKDSD